MSEGSRPTLAPFGPMGVGTIFNDHQVIPFGDRHDGVHIGHLRSQVNDDDGFRLGCDGRLNRLRSNAVAIWVNIDDDGNCPGRQGSSSGRLESTGRDDDLIPPADARSPQGAMATAMPPPCISAKRWVNSAVWGPG